MDDNLANAKDKFQRWIHIFQRNCEDPRLDILQKELAYLHYEIVDSGEPRLVREDAEFEYLFMDVIGLVDYRGDEVMHENRVSFRMPKQYTVQPNIMREEVTKPATSSSDPALEQEEALRIACDKFVVWTSKFKYACIDRDLEFLEQELCALGFRIEIAKSVLLEESPLRKVFMADVTLLRQDGAWVATEKRVKYNAPPHYQPSNRPVFGTPHSAIPMSPSSIFTAEDLSWLVTASGKTTRWPTPEDETLIAEAQKLTANQ